MTITGEINHTMNKMISMPIGESGSIFVVNVKCSCSDVFSSEI